MKGELNIPVLAESREDLDRFVGTLLRTYPRSYTSIPEQNDRPPYLGGWRQFLTIVLEEDSRRE